MSVLWGRSRFLPASSSTRAPRTPQGVRTRTKAHRNKAEASAVQRLPCRSGGPRLGNGATFRRDRSAKAPISSGDRQYGGLDGAAFAVAEGQPFLPTRHTRLRVPEVVTRTGYDHVPTNAVTYGRRNAFQRDPFTWQYCGKQPSTDELTIDHVLPRVQETGTTAKLRRIKTTFL